MKLKEHIYAIRNLITKGTPSDDTSYSLRLIAHLLNVARALLTEHKADKYTFISEQSFQSLCVPLELSVFHNCCTVTTNQCKVLKSVNPLPKFLNTRWGDFAKVMTLVGETVSKSSPTINKYAANTISNTVPKPGWFIHDNHLYIINNKVLETVLLNSLFNNPVEIEQLNCSTNTSTTCPNWDDVEYPIDPDLIQPAYLMVMQFISNSFTMPPKDTINNAFDEQTAG